MYLEHVKGAVMTFFLSQALLLNQNILVQNVQFQYFSEEKERFPRQPSDFQVEYKNKILSTRKHECKKVKLSIPLFLQLRIFDL